MSAEIHVDEKLIEAFHLMFDYFPEAVQLSHKSKKIVALNAPCKSIGREVGMICAKHCPPEGQKGCLATKTIKNHTATWTKGTQAGPGGNEPVAFWLPIDGHPDFFIHFSVGYMKDYSIPPEID